MRKEPHQSEEPCTDTVTRNHLFVSARAKLDVAQLRTITALQTIICAILFLISTARMASAHAFIAAACASALRQGLHFRSTHEASIPHNERVVRRRVFWAVTNLDMYVSIVLGLPQFLNLASVDPTIDVTIAAALNEGHQTNGPSSTAQLSLAAAAKHMELMRIIFKAQATLYPKPTDPPDSLTQNGNITVSIAKLQEVEEQFRKWTDSLDSVLSYSGNDVQVLSIKYDVQLGYYFSQIVLYRAFVHYLAEPHSGDAMSHRRLSYATLCVEMAKKAVELSVVHQSRGLLCPASWSGIYTVFLSTICLIFAYATRNEQRLETHTKHDIEDGIRLLASTACTTDTGSVRCLEILRRLIRRVRTIVDIDLDRICAETTPCCTFGFQPRTQATLLRTQRSPELSRRNSDTRSGSSQSSRPEMQWQGTAQSWNYAQDARNLRRESNFSPHPGNSGHPFQTQESGVLQASYGDGMFNWNGQQFPAHDTRLNHMQDGTPIVNVQQFQHMPSRGSGPLSSEDVAAFMHMDGLGEPYRAYPREGN